MFKFQYLNEWVQLQRQNSPERGGGGGGGIGMRALFTSTSRVNGDTSALTLSPLAGDSKDNTRNRPV